MEKVSKGLYSFDTSEWEEVSKEAKDFVKKLLSFDPSNKNFMSNLLGKRYSA